MTRASLPAFSLSAAILLASPALAEPTTVSVKVTYTRAELATPQGAARVAARIRQAAREACGAANALVVWGRGFQDCERRTIDRAVDDLGAPRVAAALGRAQTTTLADR